MDLNMPIMDGFESAAKINKLIEGHPCGRTPCTIVALTAFVDSKNVEKCSIAGMKQVLNKPARKLEIRDLIKQYCPYLPEI